MNQITIDGITYLFGESDEVVYAWFEDMSEITVQAQSFEKAKIELGAIAFDMLLEYEIERYKAHGR